MALAKIESAHQMYREGRHTEALDFYTEALSIAKTKAQKIALHSNRAACYLKLHDFRKAAEECTSVLELDHQHTGALMLRAQTLVTLKEYQSALFDVNRLMELNPTSDVYTKLQARLKTQLSLAPIPELEEETLIAEEELNEDNWKSYTEVPMADTVSESICKVVKYPRNNNEAESTHEVISEKDINKLDDNSELRQKTAETVSDKIETALHHMQETPQNTNKESMTATKETIVACTQNAEKYIIVNPKEQKAIPQTVAHSRLDYSRWDQVDSDSSEDDDDDDEEEQPRYRFRVRTFGVCPVK